jgi:hypothetical protein
LSGVVTTDARVEWLPFLLWGLVGAGLSLGVLGAMTIGIFVLPVAILAGALLLWRRGMTSPVAGALSGAGAIPLYIGWLNRDGPGFICSPTGDSGESCVAQMSPWPWLVVGLALVVAGVVVFSRLRRRSGQQSQ